MLENASAQPERHLRSIWVRLVEMDRLWETDHGNMVEAT